ncbi:MAG: histidine kinase [Chloroflexota bacterium]
MIDIRTVLLLLWMGNLAIGTLIAVYRSALNPKFPFMIFLLARIFQTLAWLLLWLRGLIPDIFSVFIGNTFLLFGWSVEAFALLSIPQKRTGFKLFCIILGSASILLNIFLYQVESSNIRIAISSVIPSILFIWPSLALALEKNASLLQRISGVLYLFFSLTGVFRAVSALSFLGTFSLMTIDLSQTLAFLAIFWMMLFGSVSFLRLSKEKTDQDLLMGIMQIAIMEERARLAREFHDSVTQSLHSLVLSSDSANRAMQTKPEQLPVILRHLTFSATQALREMRLLLYEMRPHSVNGSLLDLLDLRLEAVEKRASINADIAITQGLYWPQEWETDLYSIAVEALNNSLRHGYGNEVTISISENAGEFCMSIGDNGRGFDLQHVHNGGMGLPGMAERAANLGGRLEVVSHIDEGTLITVLINLKHKLT